MILAAGVVAVAVVVLLAVALHASADYRAWRSLAKRRVLVQMRTGGALAGVQWSRRGPLLVLRDVTLHQDGQRAPVDGEAVIERTEISWIQVLPAGGD